MSHPYGDAWWTPARRKMYSTGYPAMIRERDQRIAELECRAEAAERALAAWRERFRAIVGDDSPDGAGNAVLTLQRKLAEAAGLLRQCQQFTDDSDLFVAIRAFLAAAREDPTP